MSKECSLCGEEKKTNEKCEYCKENDVCTLTISTYYEWIDVVPECSVCKKMICRDCMVFCRTCANFGKNLAVYCENCQPENMKNVDCGCDYHYWVTCGKHSGNCGECHANKNYDDKNRI